MTLRVRILCSKIICCVPQLQTWRWSNLYIQRIGYSEFWWKYCSHNLDAVATVCCVLFVGELRSLTVSLVHILELCVLVLFRGIPINGKLEVSLDSDGCRSSPYSRVVYLEHVQAVVTLAASRRGEVEVFLTSPQGTRSTLLARRMRDASTEGFNAWAFMTIHCWGERATGTWQLEVRNGASACKSSAVNLLSCCSNTSCAAVWLLR